MLPLVNEPFFTLKPYVPGKPISETERELGLEGVVKLASNENPLGPSPKAVEAIQCALSGLHDYPDGGAYYFKERLSRFLGFSTEQLIVGNGTNELLEMIIRTCLRPDEHMIYVPGTFIVYKLCGLSANANIREVPLTSELEYNLDAVLEVMDEKTKLVFVANPNNPTGTYIGRKSLESFLAQVPEHVLVVLDEAYFEYATAPDYPNGLEYLANRERLVVTRTFSKCYGLAGLRIGYAVGNGELIDFLNRGRQPFNVNSLAQVGALAALDDQEHVQKACDLNRKEMGRVVEGLTQLRIKCTPSQANFVLADFGQDVGPLFDRLLRQGVIVRPMQGYGFPHSARITIGTPEQNNKLFKAIETLETS